MRKTIRAFAAAAILAAATAAAPRVYGQADAAAAYQQGKTAFDAGDYQKARDLFTKASQTDAKNPEVFLWLGKAQYQLGAINDAVAAWDKTLALAPQEPYAAQMLKALRGEISDADTTLTLIDAYLRDNLHEAAIPLANRLLADKALTDAQRAKALELKAGALLAANRFGEAEAAVQELLVKFPKLGGDATTLLLAKARLHTPTRTGEAVDALRKLATDRADQPVGVSAAYELLAFELEQGVTADRVDRLSKWLAAHADHDKANVARALLVNSQMALTELSARGSSDMALSAGDRAALTVAAELYARTPRAADAHALTQRIVEHFNKYYARAKAYSAGVEGLQLLAKAPLPAVSRQSVLVTLGNFQLELALREIARDAAAGKLAAGPMPKALADAVATYATLATEFPSDGAARSLVQVAERLRAIPSAGVSAGVVRPTDAWAVDVALDVIKRNADVEMTTAAVKTVSAIIADVANARDPAGPTAALQLQDRLIAALPAEHPQARDAILGKVNLLDQVARARFAANVAAGKPEANAELSDVQRQLIDTLASLATRDLKRTPEVLERLNAHLQPWTAQGRFAAARAAYERLAAALPVGQQRDVQLAIVHAWVAQAMAEQSRLVAAGGAVARKLDPSLSSALRRLYELQENVEATDPFVTRVRQEIDGIVAHYKKLGYFDVAEAAAQVKSDPANPAGDAYVDFQLAVLRDEAARRELVEVLKQYKPTDRIALTDGAKAAIAAYEKFITDRPTDPLALRAAAAVLAIGQVYEQDGAYAVARQVYADFAAFAAKVATLSKSAPGQPSVADNAAFFAVSVLDVQAHAEFAKAVAKSAAANKGVPVPPTKLSAEFTAAIDAYKAFVKAHADSPLAGQAVLRVEAIALDYARSDAWDVAGALYAQMLADGMAAREPQRIEFARGMCEVGKVMPEHAKEVLAALLGSSAASTASPDTPAVARLTTINGIAANETAAVASQPAPAAKPMGKPADSNSPANVSLGTIASRSGVADEGKAQDASGFVGGYGVAAADERAKRDNDALAAISKQEARRASQIAMMRDGAMQQNGDRRLRGGGGAGGGGAPGPQMAQGQKGGGERADAERLPVVSEEELKRQQAALDAAYKIFQAIRTKYPTTAAADQSRGEIMLAIGYWRGSGQWQRAAALAERFLTDSPTDKELPQLRLNVATDHLAWAAEKLDSPSTSQERLAEVAKRFDAARTELAKVAADFPDERAILESAQWQIATSFLTQARTVDRFSPTLARGQFVRAAKELRHIAGQYAKHPQIGSIPNILWEISLELKNRSYHEDALAVWNILAIDYPTNPLAAQALLMTAQTYQSVLGRPLRAAEVYLEMNFARGGNDVSMQDAVFSIGADLKNQKRWVEALHVLESFVQSFPKHGNAGQALAMIGQVHQANDAWADAIAAYRRVITEFPASGQWAQDAKWAIADCTINLSQWKPAIEAYESFVASYPKDSKVAEANRRIGILKDLANYQKLVDEKGPKAYDAQFQIATIVNGQLGNWRKSVEEFQKVADNWPKSHLAADALHSIGMLYLQHTDIDGARAALRQVAMAYPDSPFASDSLFQIGKSYEDEANRLMGLTRDATLEFNKDVAQRRAYITANNSRAEARQQQNDKVAELRKSGKKEAAEYQIAINAGNGQQLDDANFLLAADNANREQESLTAGQLADRQDKVNAALRKAVAVYAEAAKVPAGDKAGESLLHMAVIQHERLGDSRQAMATWQEIVRQFTGTSVAEEASWQIAQHYEKAGQYAEAVESYKSFLRNYRGSPRAPDAQFFIAENYEHLGQWIAAMDQYTNYLQNFPSGTLIQKAREQISFIKTYRL